jgi:hypothetical protein
VHFHLVAGFQSAHGPELKPFHGRHAAQTVGIIENITIEIVKFSPSLFRTVKLPGYFTKGIITSNNISFKF